MQRRRVMLAAGKRSRLPPGFREVAYLESNGAQYINIGFLPQAGCSFSAKVSLAQRAVSAERNYIVGGYGRNNKGRLQFSLSKPAFLGYGSGYSSRITIQLSSDIIYSINGNANGFFIDGGRIWTPSSNDFSSASQVYLFASNGNGTVMTQSDGLRIHEIQLANQSTEREMVPCYRESDNKPGMYDLCGSICPLTGTRFYINSGTEEFTLGPNV